MENKIFFKIMGKCQICNKRKATIRYSENWLSFAHGHIQMFCKECYIKILEDKLKDIEKQIKELKRK